MTDNDGSAQAPGREGWRWHLGGSFHTGKVDLNALSLFQGDKDKSPAKVILWYARDKDGLMQTPREAIEYEAFLNEREQHTRDLEAALERAQREREEWHKFWEGRGAWPIGTLRDEIENLKQELQQVTGERERFHEALAQIGCWESPVASRNDDYNRAWGEAARFANGIIEGAEEGTYEGIIHRAEQAEAALTEAQCEREAEKRYHAAFKAQCVTNINEIERLQAENDRIMSTYAHPTLFQDLQRQLTEAQGKAALADELRMLDEFVEAVEYDNEGCAQGACIFFASRYDAMTAPATEAAHAFGPPPDCTQTACVNWHEALLEENCCRNWAPATEAKRVCRFYPNEPCPEMNVHCRAPDCMVPAIEANDA